VRRLQRAELFDDEEQEDDHGPSGVQEVLQAVQEAYGAQRSEVSIQHSAVSIQPLGMIAVLAG
jgi:hypothetical protein